MQSRKPAGWFGRYVMPRIFNIGNADLNSFVLEMLQLKMTDRVLEIGFGTGKLINKMAGIAGGGIVDGIDFSEEMLKQAMRINQHHISNGIVRLRQGECRELPYKGDSFDKLCSINTLYFWEKPDMYFMEMFRVLKPGGKIAIGFRDGEQFENLNLSKAIFTMYSPDEVAGLLVTAGFSDVRVEKEDSGPLFSYCAVGTKAHHIPEKNDTC